MDRDLLRAELERDEGLRLSAYRDSLGWWTIGIGHLLGQEQRMTKITTSEAYALFAADIEEAETSLDRILPGWRTMMGEVRQRALVNMCFNLGNKLADFKRFLGYLETGDYEQASKAMLQSLWAKQVGERAKRLAHMVQFDATE